jgi:Rrf2 family nitric oxide-sensitive transcriptional repressor
MQLTRYTDYAFRMLIYLSLQREDARITINDIAEHFDIPRNHLIKVAQRLGQLGYIQTTRGKGGGVALGMATEEIGLGDVVRQMETQLDVVNCNQPACPILPQCKLRGILGKARDAFLDTLDQYTLADLRQRPTQLKTLLKVS